MRINKYLAQIGIASRRSVDLMVEEGRIKINNQVAKLGDQTDPLTDKISIDGNKIGDRQEQKVYIILNKPVGYISTAAKIKGEKNVLELVNPSYSSSERSESRSSKKKFSTRSNNNIPRLYPVGRLDKDSTGLILLTNDGELTQKITHPKFHIPKTYEVKALGNVDDHKIEIMQKGVVLEDGKTKPADVKIISKSLPRHSIFQITLYEGKKRQIRRMAAALHIHIIDLKRISIGPIQIGGLPLGKFRNLTKEEIKSLTTD